MPEGDLAMVVFNSEEAAPLGYLQANAGRSAHPMMIALLHERSARADAPGVACRS